MCWYIWLKALLYLVFVVIPKKIISFLLYPIGYAFRNKVWRSKTACNGDWQLDEVKKHNKGLKLFIWFLLDDSIWSETGVDYNTKCKNILHLTKSKLLNSWYWGGFRNTSVNLSHYLYRGKFIKLVKKCFSWYEIRQFEKGIYPYMEWHIFGIVINVGWLHSGKFEGPKIRSE